MKDERLEEKIGQVTMSPTHQGETIIASIDDYQNHLADDYFEKMIGTDNPNYRRKDRRYA